MLHFEFESAYVNSKPSHTVKPGYFITGTDTGVGKTLIACALLHAFAKSGKSVAGMKPVVAGCEQSQRGLIYEDVETLLAASTVAAPRQ